MFLIVAPPLLPHIRGTITYECTEREISTKQKYIILLPRLIYRQPVHSEILLTGQKSPFKAPLLQARQQNILQTWSMSGTYTS